MPTMLMRLITLVFGRIRLRRAYSGSGIVLRHMVHLMHLWQREAGQRAWESLLHGGGLLEGL
jgi:hypothetical protein